MRTETTKSDAASVASIFGRFSTLGGTFAAIGLIGVLAAYFTDASADHHAFWSSYYFGYLFWMGMTLGCITVIYLHHSIRAMWGTAILRMAEAGAKTLPFMGVAMIPIIIGVMTGHIYDWADLSKVATWNYLHQSKAHNYLNPNFFLIRQVIYWAFWIFTTERLHKSSLKQDETRNERLAAERASFAAPIGMIHVILLTGAYTDWLMSLTTFYSTLYGAWNLTKDVLMAIAFCTVVLMANKERRPYNDIVTPSLSRDLGNVLLGFTMFWGYTSLDQFLIIWSANLPDEISFYTSRFEGPLVIIGSLLIACQFAIPFMSLVTGRAKRTPEILLRVALGIFIVRIFDTWWDVVPFFRRGIVDSGMPYAFDPLRLVFDVAAWAFFGGVWLAIFAAYSKKYPLLVTHDPRLIEAKEMLAHGAH